jgi:hypothetical protein
MTTLVLPTVKKLLDGEQPWFEIHGGRNCRVPDGCCAHAKAGINSSNYPGDIQIFGSGTAISNYACYEMCPGLSPPLGLALPFKDGGVFTTSASCAQNGSVTENLLVPSQTQCLTDPASVPSPLPPTPAPAPAPAPVPGTPAFTKRNPRAL